MRSPTDDRDLNAKAIIRNAALRLFAEFGPDRVTVREIATAADVSPALILHHFGSKDGLKAAVDAHVAGVFETMLDALPDPLGESLIDPGSTSLVEALAAGFPPDSPLPAYLSRLLLTNDPASLTLFRRWYAETIKVMGDLEAAGIARPAADASVRAAILLKNDLGLVLLRPFLEAVTGLDPLSQEGAAAYMKETVLLYTEGAFQAPGTIDKEHP